MPLMRVWDDTRGKASCRSCGAEITWFELTASGKRHPFDDQPVYLRTSVIEGRLVGEIDTEVWKSHFATCPDAASWRRRHERPQS